MENGGHENRKRAIKMTPAQANRNRALHDALERVRANCDINARRAADPVQFVHRYEDPLQRELVALMASALAFGNVKALSAKTVSRLARSAWGS